MLLLKLLNCFHDQGRPGAKGDTGPPGQQGRTGLSGATGGPGPKGVKGNVVSAESWFKKNLEKMKNV